MPYLLLQTHSFSTTLLGISLVPGTMVDAEYTVHEIVLDLESIWDESDFFELTELVSVRPGAIPEGWVP